MSKKFRAVYDPGDAVITGRFPVVAADIATDAVTAVKIQADAVTNVKIAPDAVGTAEIANDAVTQPKAATGVVDGDTITGAVFQTSVPGVGHPTIMLDGPNNLGKFYAGVSGETPGTIDPSAIAGKPALIIQTGATAGAPEQPFITMGAGAASNSVLGIGASNVTMTAGSNTLQVDDGTGATIVGTLSLGGSFKGAGNAHVGYRSTAANQTLTTATLTAMNLAGTADHDIGPGYSIASNVVTVTNAGVYQLHAFCPFNTNTANCRNLLRIETWTGSDPGVGLALIIGAAELFGNTIISNWMNCNAQATFVAGQKVRVVLYHTQGTNMTTQGATTPHQLNIARLS